jgi:Tol biopolymer transport system component
MNADGSELRMLAQASGDAKPTWSPDGRTIVFSSANSIEWIRADGGERGVIVADGHSPAWRP